MSRLIDRVGSLLREYREIRRVFWFIVAGGSGFLVHLATMTILVELFDWWYFAAFLVGGLMSWFVIFLVNRSRTFSDIDRSRTGTRLAFFYGGYAVIYLINIMLVAVFTSGVGLHYALSLTLGSAITAVFTFLFLKSAVFRPSAELTQPSWTYIVLVVVSAVFVGVVNVLPHLERIHLLSEVGEEYAPYSVVQDFDATNVIGPRIKEVLDGNFFVSDTDLFEYKDAPALWPPLPPLFYLPFTAVTDSVSKVVVASDFLYTPLLFLLILWLVYVVSGRRKWFALVYAGIAALYVYWSIDVPPGSLGALEQFLSSLSPLGDPSHVAPLARRESFLPGLFPFLGFLIAFWYSIEKPTKGLAILAGVLLSLNAYTYPFHMLYVSAIFGVAAIVLLYRYRGVYLHTLIYTAVTAVVVGIPFFIQEHVRSQLPHAQELLFRHGLEVGRVFSTQYIERYLWVLILVVALVLLRNYLKRASWTLAMAMLVAMPILLNQQLLLGFTVQPDHWLNRDFVWGFHVVYALLLSQLGLRVVRFFPNAQKVFAVVGVVLVLSVSASATEHAVARARSDFYERTIPQADVLALEWLNNNTPQDSVVVSPSLVTNYLVPLYTSSRIYIPRALGTLASEEEAFTRLFEVYRYLGVEGEYLEWQLENHDVLSTDRDTLEGYERELVLYIVSNQYVSREPGTYTSGGGFAFDLPKERRDEILKGFSQFSCEDCLSYTADYLYVSDRERAIGIEVPEGATAIYDNAGVVVYEL